MTIDKASQSTTDQAMMQRVLEIAAQGFETTHPNPRVGCVIVNNGKIVGEGYHVSAGQLHAERDALAAAGDQARGATAYVNLEPCCHQGRTPPCTDGLIDAGVKRVVVSIVDPNPMVSGGGIKLLKEAGISTEVGLLSEQATILNKGFIQRLSRQKPWVTLKSAATLDGRTAAFDGESKWITGTDARAKVQTLRATSSAILTGIGTILADDPQLNVRKEDVQRQPIRIVLDSQLRIPLDARVIGADQTLIVFTLSNDLDKISALQELGVEVVQQQNTDNAKLNLNKVLSELVKWECNELLVEAGQTLSGAFLQAGLVDELVLFYAGTLLGDKGKSMFEFNAPLSFADRVEYRIKHVEMVGADFKVLAVNEESYQQLIDSTNLT